MKKILHKNHMKFKLTFVSTFSSSSFSLEMRFGKNFFYKMSAFSVLFNLKATDQSDHETKLYTYSFMQNNFFNLQSIFLKIWET